MSEILRYNIFSSAKQVNGLWKFGEPIIKLEVKVSEKEPVTIFTNIIFAAQIRGARGNRYSLCVTPPNGGSAEITNDLYDGAEDPAEMIVSFDLAVWHGKLGKYTLSLYENNQPEPKAVVQFDVCEE